MNWTTPEDLRTQVQKHWDNGRLLATVVDEVAADALARGSPAGDAAEIANAKELFSPTDGAGISMPSEQDGPALSVAPCAPALNFPLALRFRKPGPRDLGTRFDEVRDWIKSLEAGSRDTLGAGYDIEWEETSNRLLGRNATPCRIVVPTRVDALAMIDAVGAAERFMALARETLNRFPELAGWLRSNPLAAFAEADAWHCILSVLDWFRAHPGSGLYVRQIDVLGVDTKFIEVRKALLGQLLDAILRADFVDPSSTGTAGFEQRYGLAAKPTLIRVRILDPSLAISGLTDLAVRIDELARLDIAAERVFIVENEITGLAFPPREKSILIFGGGYAIERLACLPWLCTCAVRYWGDIDTHGFVMLDRLRAFLPDARSILMDRQTLLDHRPLWTFEETPHIAALTRLSPDEQALYDNLRFDRLGRGVRLEQERVSFSAILPALPPSPPVVEALPKSCDEQAAPPAASRDCIACRCYPATHPDFMD